MAILPTTATSQIVGMRNFGNRLEGTKVRPNALDDFKILAIHRATPSFTRNALLAVRFFVPLECDGNVPKVSLVASELQDSHHYLMEAKPDLRWRSGQVARFGPWPTNDVIDVLSIQPGNLAVLAACQPEKSPPVYLPVDVFAGSARSTAATLIIYFVTGRDLQSLTPSVTTASGQKTSLRTPVITCNLRINPNCTIYPAGSTQAISLDMSPLQKGMYHISLFGAIPRTIDKTSIDVLVYHDP